MIKKTFVTSLKSLEVSWTLLIKKVIKGKSKVMNELKMYSDRLESFGRELAYSSREILQPGKSYLIY